jgi:uncharacterized membrane protein YphA (DoxX/SURF4 family)
MRLPGTILQGILARSALTFLRIYLGGVFLLLAWYGFREGFPRYTGVYLVPWVQLLVGITLVLGLLTRLSAAGALVVALTPLVLATRAPWPPTSVQLAWASVAAIAIALIVGAGGRTFGLDALLAKRWARSPFW